MNKFEPNNLVKECMKNEDIMGLRGALIGIILGDRTLSNEKLDNTLNFIASKNINIYEKFDGGDIVFNTVENRNFTEENYSEAIFNLKSNFCKERITDVKNISKELYGSNPKKEESVSITDKNGGDPGKKQTSHQREVNQSKGNNSMKILGAIAVVAVVAVAVGLVINSMNQ